MCVWTKWWIQFRSRITFRCIYDRYHLYQQQGSPNQHPWNSSQQSSLISVNGRDIDTWLAVFALWTPYSDVPCVLRVLLINAIQTHPDTLPVTFTHNASFPMILCLFVILPTNRSQVLSRPLQQPSWLESLTETQLCDSRDGKLMLQGCK